MIRPWQLRRAVRLLRGGGVIAYPTEAVYGLGCDPLDAQAVTRLLALKGRRADKGLILIADTFEAFAPYLLPLCAEARARVLATWPGPVTWLLPARPECPPWLRGAHDTLAVRVPEHAQARELCAAFGGALVSTSANRTGHRAATSALRVRLQLGAQVDYVLHAPLGGRTLPSEIRDLRSGQVLRAG